MNKKPSLEKKILKNIVKGGIGTNFFGKTFLSKRFVLIKSLNEKQ